MTAADLPVVISYMVGSWLVGFMIGMLLRVVFRSYTEWFS